MPIALPCVISTVISSDLPLITQAAAREHERAQREASRRHALAAEAAEARAAEAEAGLRQERQRGRAWLLEARQESDALATECDALRRHVAELEAALVALRRQRQPELPPARAAAPPLEPEPEPELEPPTARPLATARPPPRSPPQTRRAASPLEVRGDLMDRIVVMRHYDYFQQYIGQ
jgi:rRNA-processing protein FCF1